MCLETGLWPSTKANQEKSRYTTICFVTGPVSSLHRTVKYAFAPQLPVPRIWPSLVLLELSYSYSPKVFSSITSFEKSVRMRE